ncbi:MAG: zinc ABC transporter substrate-binding protein [Stellaceae bacterium]
MKHLAVFAATAALLIAPAPAWAARPIAVLAAENFYGDIAQQIGGPDVEVTRILSNPDQDPHLFEASPSVARAVSTAPIVIYNGLDYDPWIEKLLNAAASSDRTVIIVGDLVGRRPGDNPHIWYDPNSALALAARLADDLSTVDPAHQGDYQQRLAEFRRSLQPIQEKIAALRARLAGTPVTATEPVFNYLLDAIGMQVRNRRFQLAVMNNTEPGASDVAAFESDLKKHQVRMLVYNSQASDPTAERMVRLARTSDIPVVAVTETEPPGKNYQEWLLSELDAVDRALPKQQP